MSNKGQMEVVQSALLRNIKNSSGRLFDNFKCSETSAAWGFLGVLMNRCGRRLPWGKRSTVGVWIDQLVVQHHHPQAIFCVFVFRKETKRSYTTKENMCTCLHVKRFSGWGSWLKSRMPFWLTVQLPPWSSKPWGL